MAIANSASDLPCCSITIFEYARKRSSVLVIFHSDKRIATYNKYYYDCVFVYVIACFFVVFGINSTSVTGWSSEIARGEAECYFTASTSNTSAIYPKYHKKSMLSHVNPIITTLCLLCIAIIMTVPIYHGVPSYYT